MRQTAEGLKTRVRAVTGVLVLVLLCPWAWAGIFDDDEARRAILDLRQKVEAQGQAAREESEIAKKAILELQSSIEQLRAEQARLLGANEQLGKELADVQRRLGELSQGVEARVRRLEPVKVKPDSREFMADPTELRDYEAALLLFRRGDYVTAQQAFGDFQRRYPQSGFLPLTHFWSGSAAFGNRDYRESIRLLRQFAEATPESAKVPEALLITANSQVELRDIRSARKTLEELIKTHPDSEAAAAARDRLNRLR